MQWGIAFSEQDTCSPIALPMDTLDEATGDETVLRGLRLSQLHRPYHNWDAMPAFEGILGQPRLNIIRRRR